ncbi:MAG: hypothetical protein V4598_08655 [Bdellovibrionota bacterium]
MKIFAFFLLMTTAIAQHSEQPVKEDSSDLREETLVFSIEEVGKDKSWLLERSPSFTNVLKKKVKDEETVRKIDGRVAQKLDRDFASRFLKCQYEIPAVEGDCKVTLRLIMKGESQEICEKDDKKSQEILTFVEDLSKRF